MKTSGLADRFTLYDTVNRASSECSRKMAIHCMIRITKRSVKMDALAVLETTCMSSAVLPFNLDLLAVAKDLVYLSIVLPNSGVCFISLGLLHCYDKRKLEDIQRCEARFMFIYSLSNRLSDIIKYLSFETLECGMKSPS